jgi:hypothetical protein
MTADTLEKKIALYEHLRTHGQMPQNEPTGLRREVYAMVWRALPPAVKADLAKARESFQTDQYAQIEREALMSLPPYYQLGAH